MKQLVIGTFIFAALSSAALADELNYNITVQKNKNGTVESIQSTTVVGHVGKATPFAATQTNSYIAEVKKKTPEGKTEITPGSISTGFTASLTPKAVDLKSGAVDTEFTVNMTELNDIIDLKGGDLATQKPVVVVLLKSNGRVVLMPGHQPVVIATGSDGVEVLASIKQ